MFLVNNKNWLKSLRLYCPSIINPLLPSLPICLLNRISSRSTAPASVKMSNPPCVPTGPGSNSSQHLSDCVLYYRYPSEGLPTSSSSWRAVILILFISIPWCAAQSIRHRNSTPTSVPKFSAYLFLQLLSSVQFYLISFPWNIIAFAFSSFSQNIPLSVAKLEDKRWI